MNFFQGDQYSIMFQILTCQSPLDLTDVATIEFSLGDMVKSYPIEVEYDEDTHAFLFPVTQAETFKLDGYVDYQARIKYNNGNVYGTPINKIMINNSISSNII